MSDVESIKQSWNAIRATLQNDFSFYKIKDIIGRAGFDLTSIAHLEQEGVGGASKGQLMTAIDLGLAKLDEESMKRFIAITAEEVLKKIPIQGNC